MKRAVIVQHTPSEGPGRLERLLAARGAAWETCHVYRGDPILDDVAPDEPVLVMGGAMGVGDAGDPRYPFLAKEIARLRELLGRNQPVLGICLGSQLLAAAAGARVYPNTRPGPDGRPVPVREVGWGPVDFLGVEREPALAGLGKRELMLHWHGDTYDLPAGAVHLASTAACQHQAFRLGTRQFALQFHPELEAQTIATWVREDADYVRAANGEGGAAQILTDTDRYLPGAGPVWDRLLGNIPDLMLRES